MTQEEADRDELTLWVGSRITQVILHANVDQTNQNPYLAHYGVKGMRWGIRKEEETEGNSQKSEFEKANKPKKAASAKEAADNLAKNEKKFQEKFLGNDPVKKQNFLVKNKKKLIAAGVVAAAVAAIYFESRAQRSRDESIKESISGFRGKKISLDDYTNHVNHSKDKTWMNDHYLTPEAFAREGFSLPAGHTFHRLSSEAETEFFGNASYATHSQEDFDRYSAIFRHEKIGVSDFHHVTWQSKEEIKVPDLNTVLSTFREALSGDVKKLSHSDILDEYQGLSGGGWNGSTASKLFESLARKGYGAIVDEMDAGVIGETPLVVFAHRLMGEKSSSPLTQADFDRSESNLIEINNRKL